MVEAQRSPLTSPQSFDEILTLRPTQISQISCQNSKMVNFSAAAEFLTNPISCAINLDSSKPRTKRSREWVIVVQGK